ncbi:LytTR family DNA-binding domain-containing protein [Clostridium sardiniense]|uniref:Stage 0 sporulation protein A homolog n=1 Tax=Clostridium sardiniense TaxID=29369 RepID=A0ABS7KSX7_CLOSR|nr:LytTR family DNA-binding domain-containing protein [Clostridium sardiniense]MBY0753915.1 LytTR family DNA-binding domain-containing protein [Clostridium sardiniense]MDQ0459570.1 DNA-binding LytR/AlgR family response regulator [Clostridium sardiniense]
MVNIAICDDQGYDRINLKNILEKIAIKNNIIIKIEEFNSGRELLSVYQRDIPKYDVVFLDMILGDSNGIDIAKRIIEFNESVKFIILSSSKEFILDGYEISAVNYIIKPPSIDRIEKELLRAIEIINSNEEFYEINKNGSKLLLKLNDIYYLEVEHRKINVYKKDDVINYYEKLENVERDLEEKGFKRCHRSYVINISKIKELKSNEIRLLNGQVIPIGRKYRESLKESFFNYLQMV